MIDILLAAIIILAGSTLLEIINNRRNNNKQHTFVYCPKCNTELIKNGLLVTVKDGIAQYKCPECGTVSFWDFVSCPVPYLRTCQDCECLLIDKVGSPYCEKKRRKECHPGTQRAFEYKLNRSELAMKDILESEKKFRYMMLDRMRQDCEYYLRIGGSANILWAGNEKQHIQNMKDIWNSFDEKDKPEWLTWEQIEQFEKKMVGEKDGKI